MTQYTDLCAQAEAAMAEHKAHVEAQGGIVTSHGLMPALVAAIRELEAERDEALRRRDTWKAKAEGYDEMAAAVRAKVKAEPATMSRLLLKAALIESEAKVAELTRERDAVEALDVDTLAKILLDEWCRVDPKSNVAMYPVSYVATFADMARAVLAAIRKGATP